MDKDSDGDDDVSAVEKNVKVEAVGRRGAAAATGRQSSPKKGASHAESQILQKAPTIFPKRQPGAQGPKP